MLNPPPGIVVRAFDTATASWWGRAAIVLLLCAGLASAFATPYRIDLDVYRTGALVYLGGGSLYGELPPLSTGLALPFTYPPFAAQLFTGFTLVSLPAAAALLTGVSIACLAWTSWIVVADHGFGQRPWPFILAVSGSLFLEPVRQTLSFGQINLILMAMVATDAIAWRGRRRAGVLVGVAMAVKLTPAVFLALFIVRRDWRALATALMSFALCTGVGFLLSPGDSRVYWTRTIRDSERIGGLSYAGNQSINGELHRLGIDGGALAIAWFVAATAMACLLLWLVHRLTSRGDHAAAVSFTALIALFCSPVSWSHHWVWAAPLLLVATLWFVEGRGARWLALAAWGAALLGAGPHWWLPHRSDAELSWTWWQHLVGSSYLLWGLILAVVAVRSLREAPSHEPDTVGTEAGADDTRMTRAS